MPRVYSVLGVSCKAPCQRCSKEGKKDLAEEKPIAHLASYVIG